VKELDATRCYQIRKLLFKDRTAEELSRGLSRRMLETCGTGKAVWTIVAEYEAVMIVAGTTGGSRVGDRLVPAWP
jgi:hypothetical protein